MYVNNNTRQIGHEFVKEAEDFPGKWKPDLIRGVMDQRVKFKKLIAREGGGRSPRRRPKDEVAA